MDFCDCEGLHASALQLMLRNNKSLEKIQLSGCANGVDDKVMRLIANQPLLEFLDVSYCNQITDNGLVHFSDKILPITAIYMNGLNKVSSLGASSLINCCKAALTDLEASCMDPDLFKPDVFLKLA